jgi:TatD DNase family protein
MKQTRNLIDTHNHLYLEAFDEDRELIIQEAKDSGIELLLLPNVDLESIEQMHRLCDKHPEFTKPMMGLHPTSVDKTYNKALEVIEYNLGKRSYCAIGEIGIDLYWDKTYLSEQIEVFEKQLQWSIDMNLPVVIHSREAHAHIMESIHKVGADQLRGVFHSFTGTQQDLDEIQLLKNFSIGINGVITFKNSNLKEILPSFDINRMLLETDAPYLAPVPFRGKRNEPQYIWKTAEAIASIYNVSVEKVVEITRKNAVRLFFNGNKLI